MGLDHNIPLPILRAIDPSVGSRTRSEIEALLANLSPVELQSVSEGLELLTAAIEKLGPLIDASEQFGLRPENRRLPNSSERQKVSLDDCLVLTKSSVLVYDMASLGKSESEVIEWYRSQGYPQRRIDSIIESDREQKRSIAETEEVFRRAGISEQRVFVLDELESKRAAELVANYPVILSLGGDDHAKAAAQYVGEEQYLCIINSDEKRSTGAITSFSRGDLERLTHKLAEGAFLIEEWPRLDVKIQKTEGNRTILINPPPSLSEITVMDTFSLYTYRGSMSGRFLPEPIEIKGTGLIVANGVGSTGWFSSTGKYVFPSGRKFLRTDPHLEFMVREPYGKSGPEEYYTGAFGPDDVLVIRTTSKHTPEVSGDSGWKVRFGAGDEVQISMSERPLRVITGLA